MITETINRLELIALNKALLAKQAYTNRLHNPREIAIARQQEQAIKERIKHLKRTRREAVAIA